MTPTYTPPARGARVCSYCGTPWTDAHAATCDYVPLSRSWLAAEHQRLHDEATASGRALGATEGYADGLADAYARVRAALVHVPDALAVLDSLAADR